MAKVEAKVRLDDEVLRRVDAVAQQSGRSREQVIEDSIRRGLSGRVLGDVLARVRSRSDLTEEQAVELAYDEIKAARADRRSAPPGRSPA